MHQKAHCKISHPPTCHSRSQERLPTSKGQGTHSLLLFLLMCLPSSAAPPSLPFFPFFLYLLLSPMMLMRVTDSGPKKEGALWVLTAVQRSRVQASARRTKCHTVISMTRLQKWPHSCKSRAVPAPGSAIHCLLQVLPCCGEHSALPTLRTLPWLCWRPLRHLLLVAVSFLLI